MNERHFRLYERIVAIEDSLEALGPIDKLIERIEELEKMVKQTKTVLFVLEQPLVDFFSIKIQHFSPWLIVWNFFCGCKFV